MHNMTFLEFAKQASHTKQSSNHPIIQWGEFHPNPFSKGGPSRGRRGLPARQRLPGRGRWLVRAAQMAARKIHSKENGYGFGYAFYG